MYELKAGDDTSFRAYSIGDNEELYVRAERAFATGEFQEGIDLFAYLAHVGDPKAQTRLGAIAEAGQLVKKDTKHARALYQAAVDHDFAEAQLALARTYYKGIGVAKDLARAASLFLMAAEKGNKHGQYRLGEMLWAGHGVPRNAEQAYAYDRRRVVG